MATSTFRSEVAKGSGFEESITRQFVAADANIGLYVLVFDLSYGSLHFFDFGRNYQVVWYALFLL